MIMPRNELSEKEREALEAFIDSYNLAAVVRALGLVCLEKSDHVQVNWQDKGLSIAWKNAHIALMQTSERSAIVDVSF
jgi:hypothetical protein